MTKRALSQILALLALAGAACSSDPAEPNQSLAIALGGTGDGTVTSNPAGITCTVSRGVAGGR